MNKVKVFISYSTEDRRLAGEIRRLVEQDERFSCFLAHDDIESGSEWEKAIISALTASDVVLPIQTINFNNSSWCQQEVGIAFQSNKLIIPLCPNDETGAMPKGFHARYQVYILKSNNLEESIKALLASDLMAKRNELVKADSSIAARFRSVIAEGNEAKLQLMIEDEKVKALRFINTTYLNLKAIDEWQKYWEAHNIALDQCGTIVILANEILRFKNIAAWEMLIPFLHELHSINESQERYSNGGWINYLFYSLFLMLGGIALHHESIPGISRLIRLRKMQRDKYRNILGWNIHATYLELKNSESETKYYVPRFHYLLDYVESNKFPVPIKQIKNHVIDFDFLCFICSIKISSRDWPWYPGSIYYFDYRSPDFLVMIDQDVEARERWANGLLDMTGDEFMKYLKDEIVSMYNNLAHKSQGFVGDSPFRGLFQPQ